MKELIILGMVFLSTNAFAGNEKGNGGGVHFCSQQNQVEMYDIFEAEARYGFIIKNDQSSVDTQVSKAINKIAKSNSFIARLVAEKIEYLKDDHTLIKSKARLTPIGDANILIVDEGCSYEQLANWDEVSGNLIVKKEYFDRMNDLNKAAFFIHETLYKVGRDLDLLIKNHDGTTNSDEVRRMVGEIFSTNKNLTLMWTIVDPQIEIDRTNALATPLVNSCKEAVTETIKLGKLAKSALEENYIRSYYQSYFKSFDICINNKYKAEAVSRDSLINQRDLKFAMTNAVKRIENSIDELRLNRYVPIH